MMKAECQPDKGESHVQRELLIEKNFQPSINQFVPIFFCKFICFTQFHFFLLECEVHFLSTSLPSSTFFEDLLFLWRKIDMTLD